MANSVDPDQVCSGSTLFASILNLLVMLDNYLQQTTSADDIFRCIFFLALQVLRESFDIENMIFGSIRFQISKLNIENRNSI